MDEVVADIAQAVDVPPVNAGLVFDGPKIKIVKGQKGRVVDRKALASQLTACSSPSRRPTWPCP